MVSSSAPASSMCVTPPYCVSRSRARSTAVLPRTPERSSTATSSPSLSATAPFASSFSRGRSSSGHSEILMAWAYNPHPLTGAGAMTLTGRKILLGLTGGIAAYKAAELTRLLVKRGADVRVVMTEAAARFITPTTMQALSGQQVWTDLWDPRVNDAMGHIELSRDRELIAVAPASADFIAKLAHGLADDLLSTLCLARRCPLVVAPAMNVEMWQNAATRRNVAKLREDTSVVFAGPAAGDQACGEVGLGRMLEPADIAATIEAQFAPKALSGKRVLVTAGPTEEPVDPVRMLTNASSGKMGYAVARAAREAGAQGTLGAGPVGLPTPQGFA